MLATTKSVTLLFQTSCWAPGPKQLNNAPPKTNLTSLSSPPHLDGGGSCAVSWIVESEGSRGINYEVRALCTSASLPEKTQTVTIMVRTLGSDRAEMGRFYLHSAGSVFDDLKKYQRCP